MNKLKKNIESNTAIFALGGMDIKVASALLVLNDNPMLRIAGIHKKAARKRTLPIWSAKYMLRNIFAAVAIIILSPVLFSISVFNLASLIRSSLLNNQRSADREGRLHKNKIINLVRNITASKSKSFNTDRSNFHRTNSARNNISITGKNASIFTEKGQAFTDKAAQYERMQLEMVLVNPVRIVAWHISPEGIMLNRENWVEMEIKSSDIRLLNKNATLFCKTFQHVLLKKVN